MVLRRLAAFALLCLGLWLAYDGLQAVLIITSHGSDLQSALFSPPTSAIRITAAAIMMFGGALATFRIKSGGIFGMIGSILFTALGALMAQAGTQQSLWLDEVLYGVGAIGVSVLILTLRRI
ncbi:MAG: hypothetical protein Hens3KO_16530 [Henriciella sp.]